MTELLLEENEGENFLFTQKDCNLFQLFLRSELVVSILLCPLAKKKEDLQRIYGSASCHFVLHTPRVTVECLTHIVITGGQEKKKKGLAGLGRGGGYDAAGGPSLLGAPGFSSSSSTSPSEDR